MAKGPYTDSAGTYVIVESGDNLSTIAKKYGDGKTTKQIAALNPEIKDVNLIYIDQKIYVSKSNSGSGSGSGSGSNPDSGSTTVDSNKVTIKQFGLLSSSENTLFATWDWSKSNQTESYKVLWAYRDGNGTVLVGDDSSISVDSVTPTASRQSTYAIPNGALEVKFKVKPISKKKTVNGKETTYWTGEWTDFKIYKCTTPLKTPDIPNVEIKNDTLTATLKNIDIEGADRIEFEIICDNSTKFCDNAVVKIVSTDASYSCTVKAGSEYKVRCRAAKGTKLYSEWSAYSDNYKSSPIAPSEITSIRVDAEQTVYLEWTKVSTATNYEIQYTTKKEYFDASNQVQSITTELNEARYIIPDLTPGEEYFFRVRALIDDLKSGWCEIASIVVGKKPDAPTTWSSTTTATTNETVFLYWTHNSEDGSKQTAAELQLDINGSITKYVLTDEFSNTVIAYKPLTTEEIEEGKNNSCKLTIKDKGASVKWRVSTKGIHEEYSPYSIWRTIDFYETPTMSIGLTNKNGSYITTVESFPIYISGISKPDEQTPIGYHVTITSNEVYDTLDSVGRDRTVNVNEELYSKHFDVFDGWESPHKLLVELLPGSIDLANNVSYTITCTVTMNSGLSAVGSDKFTVAWKEVSSDPNAEISIDENTFSAYIRPFCETVSLTRYEVTLNNGRYVKGNNRLVNVYGTEIPGKTTNTGEYVFSGEDVNGNSIYFCEVLEKTDVTNVLLSVYRREFDGSFTEIASGLDGQNRTTVVDPHPSLDMARYRIVATSKDTGAITYYDVPGYPVGGVAAIIQWDEVWTKFDNTEEDELEHPPWSGSLLKLPYNIDVSDNANPDVTLIEYIGREHPVGYYGTQVGQNSSWNMLIAKSDKDTLYALRRLQRWLGNVYVREPSGSGYWANINVSFSQKHCEVAVPVTLNIVRVEGGV